MSELINKIVIEEARKCFIKKLLPKDKEELCFKVFRSSYSNDIAVNSCKRIRCETLKECLKIVRKGRSPNRGFHYNVEYEMNKLLQEKECKP